MSGSSGGGGVGGPATHADCELLKFDAQLTSPKPAVVATLKVGEALNVVVAEMNGQVVVQALKNGQLAGGLTGPDAARLRDCIGEGHNYSASVLSVNGGQVRVRVAYAP